MKKLIPLQVGRSWQLLVSYLATVSLVILSSCEKYSLRPEVADSEASLSMAQHTKGENPFTVAIMQQAYAKLATKRTGEQPAASQQMASATAATTTGEENSVVHPTHLYLRYKPADINQLADLGDFGFNLSWEPLDESVAATTTVNYQSDEIPWIYTVVPVDAIRPANIQSEQIAQLFLFNEEDGDKQDNDPWEPAPDPGPDPCAPHWDPNCQCYVQCLVAGPNQPTTSARQGQYQPQAKPHKLSKQAAATARLKQAGISPKDLYDVAMRLSGQAEETAIAIDQVASATSATTSSRYHPNGKIQVQDTELGLVPLRGVEVKSRRWFQFGSTFTDDRGNFAISTSYHSLAKLSLNFKNSLATTRGLVDGLKFWTGVLPISAEIGSYERGDMENVNYVISYIGGVDNVRSKGASTWAAATLFNSLAESRDFAWTRGIPAPTRGINVWLLPDYPPKKSGAGSAPMLRTIANTSIVSQTIDFLLFGSGMGSLYLVKQILQRQLPDVLIRYGGDGGAIPTRDFKPLVYHELGHTQHYNQVGNSFWIDYIGYIVAHGGYGEKSDSDAGRIAVSEGWGNYIERLFTIDKYQSSTSSQWSNFAAAELENQVPDDNSGVVTVRGRYTHGWLIFGMYHDMTDNGEPTALTGVTDNVNAFTTATVYRGLQSGVVSVRGYQARIQDQTNGLQAPQMEQLVTTYRW